MSAIIAARGNRSRLNSRRRNGGGACRPLLRDAAWRLWRRRDQGGKAGNWRPVTQLGPAVYGQRIRLLSRGKSQQTFDYPQLRSSARRGSIAETSCHRRRFYFQPTVTRIAAQTRHLSIIIVREISPADLLQYHRIRINRAERWHA